ncbi:hypothetical protein EDB19DRAFT_1825107 [Suillus lakei]|nr:hypothetical protein EDB19DRAFT_1825107 [Suillus lakei]
MRTEICRYTELLLGLARHLPGVEIFAQLVADGEKSWDEHAEFESLSRNRVSNISFTISSLGEILILVIMVGILEGLEAGDSTANNTKAFSVFIAFSGALWPLPPSSSLLTIGFRQTYVALRECMRLKQTFLSYYISSYISTVIGTLQNSIVPYSTWQLTLLLIVGIITQVIGILILVQKKFKISTKAMLRFNVIWILVLVALGALRIMSVQVLTVWGLVGVHTDKFGFEHAWEI